MHRFWKLSLLGVLVLSISNIIRAQPIEELPSIEIRSSAQTLLGTGGAASEGVISTQRLAAMPLLRPGEVLEMVPGLIVTQHAGDGKANQYFLRGFNLDHGTDFATYLDGMPLNMPSHAHGQGYTDLNFLIPELMESIQYRKGPYSAEEGDFSSAGAARLHSLRTLTSTLSQLTMGPNGYQRGLLAGSPAVGSGHLLYGLEFLNNNGPWLVPEKNRKLNAMLRYSEGSNSDGFSVSGMAYNNTWTSTDQIPQRAIDQGLVSRFGSLDPTAGGITSRYSLSGEWAAKTSTSQTRANLWLLQSSLDLWSNFAYCLADLQANNNCNTGDQFKQTERRLAAGFAASHSVLSTWGQRDLTHSFGVQGRQDQLSPVSLFNTYQREIWNTVRQDRIQQRSLSVWAQTEIRWTETLRTITGLRGDSFDFQVNSSLPANSGHSLAQLITPKLALIWRPTLSNELYLNYGQGFHSNDARGTTIRVDPNDPSQSATPVPGLVLTTGQEIGLRSNVLPGWQSTLALWQLDSASELLFVGDAGTTEPSRPSRRYGVEWSHVYTINRQWGLDADLAWSHARFKDFASEGNMIPGAIATTANLGLRYEPASPWSGTLRMRYFGPRPLTEDGTVQSAASWLFNLRVGYKVSPRTQWSLDVYNLLNSPANDIEYWYASRMRGEAQATLDRHIHPVEPRMARLTLTHRFE
jgi:outer membrane receptor protein involved in Fe transport